MTVEILATIAGTHNNGGPFQAGIVLWDDVVIEAAPIVSYMKRQRWNRDQVRAHCAEKGWEISVAWRTERTDASPSTTRTGQ